MIYRFERFQLDTDRRELRCDEAIRAIEPQVYAMLLYLLENANRVVSKDEIVEHVWNGRIISDAAINSRVRLVRHAIDDDGKQQRLIKTIHSQGFRFIGTLDADDERPPTLSMDNVQALKNLPPELSIAVLPFADLSADKDQDYFSDGMSEEILNALAKIPELLVAGRTSSFSFKNQNMDVREIAAALNTAFVLEGSVRKQGEKVRITAQLIRASDGFHRWSENYDGTLEDIFDLQERVSRAIAGELKILLDIGNSGRLAGKLTDSQQAYDLYLRARSNLYGDTTEENYQNTLPLLEKALEIDPQFASAWALLSRVRLNYAAYVWTGSPKDNYHRIKFAAERALEIDPHSADALAVISQCHIFGGNGFQAYELAKQALEEQPNNPTIIHNWGHVNCQLGYCTTAIQAMERAIAMDPIYSGYWNNLGVAYQNIGEFEKAEVNARRAAGLGDFGGHTTLAWNAHAMGDVAAAERHMLNMFKILVGQLTDDPDSQQLPLLVAKALFGEDPTDFAAMRDILEKQSSHPKFLPSGLSVNGAAFFGLIDGFFEQWNQVHFARGNLGLMLWSSFEWARNIREHTRFQDFAEIEGWANVWDKYGFPDCIA